MARLPIPGGDDNTWGGILNDFLSQSLNSDGSLKSVPRASMDSSTQASLSRADSAVQSVNGKTGSSVTLSASDVGAPTTLAGQGDVSISGPSNGQGLIYNSGPGKWTNQVLPSAPVSSVAGKTGAVTLVEGDIASLTADLGATEKTANKGAASGYAPLDSGSKVPIANLPTGSTSSTVAIGNDARLAAASTAVQSVNSKTGNSITLAPSDIGAIPISAFMAKGDLLAGTGVGASTNLAVGTNGQVLSADSTQTTGVKWATSVSGAQALTATVVQTSPYSASPGDFVPVDASGASVTITLPTAPADKTRIGVKMINVSGSNTTTISRGGSSDVFNKAGGSTSLTLSALFQGVLLQYASSTGIWYVQADDVPLNIASGAAKLGTDGTVGGPSGSPLSSSVVSSSHLAINVQGIGGVPGTDCSSVILTAIAAAPNPQAIELYFPAAASAYKLKLGALGTISSGQGVSIKLCGDGQRASIIAPVDATDPMFTVQGPPDGSTQGFAMTDIGVVNTAHRSYATPLIQLTNARAYSVEQVQLDGGSFEGTFFSKESCYNGAWRDVSGFNMKYAIPVIHTNALAPLQECDNFIYEGVKISGGMGPIFRNAGDLNRSLIAIGLKLVQSSNYSGGAPGFLGTLSAPVNIGDTSCTFTATFGTPAINDLICVGQEGNGKSVDVARVTNVVGSTITISATNPFQFAHTAGAPIQNGGMALTIGDAFHQAVIIAPHFEGYVVGLSLGAVQQVDIYSFEDVCAYAIRNCNTINGVHVHGVSMAGNSVLNGGTNQLFSQSADVAGTISDYRVTGPVFVPAGSPAANSAPNSSAAYQWDFRDAGSSIATRKNNTSTSTDRAWEVTVANAKKWAVLYNGVQQVSLLQSLLTGGGAISSGSGAPTTPNGINPTAGDLYVRTDTADTAAQQVYLCTVGGGSPTWRPLFAPYGRRLGFTGWATPQMPPGMPSAGGNVTMAANTGYLTRFVPDEDLTVSQIGWIVTTFAGANDSVQVGLFDSTGATLLASSTSSGTTGLMNSNGNKTLAFASAFALTAGNVYYACLAYSTLGGTAPVVQGINANSAAVPAAFGSSLPNLLSGAHTAFFPIPTPSGTPAAQQISPMLLVLQ